MEQQTENNFLYSSEEQRRRQEKMADSQQIPSGISQSDRHEESIRKLNIKKSLTPSLLCLLLGGGKYKLVRDFSILSNFYVMKIFI